MKQKRYGILDNITSPADLRGLSYDTLGVLCAALREFIVDSVSQTGGHLASNQLHDAQIGRQMTAGLRHRVHNELAQRSAQHAECVVRQSAQIGRTAYIV